MNAGVETWTRGRQAGRNQAIPGPVDGKGQRDVGEINRYQVMGKVETRKDEKNERR
ncbi:hypothetical protein D1BOALGB6SA_5502 [Olavius sp. associated proteobacterium Delta 1]|nr:hypothetical protein D1BOALGB6SA_5502 [Olavius sp. associated proteobacterium Delta 1]